MPDIVIFSAEKRLGSFSIISGTSFCGDDYYDNLEVAAHPVNINMRATINVTSNFFDRISMSSFKVLIN